MQTFFFALATINSAKENVLLMKILRIIVSRAGECSKTELRTCQFHDLCRKLSIFGSLKNLGQEFICQEFLLKFMNPLSNENSKIKM